MMLKQKKGLESQLWSLGERVSFGLSGRESACKASATRHARAGGRAIRMFMCACVRGSVLPYARVCVRVCVREWVRFASVRTLVSARLRACLFACVRACVPARVRACARAYDSPRAPHLEAGELVAALVRLDGGGLLELGSKVGALLF
eukprot:6196369-Pleurochrysis_carterae.AAC.1